MALAIHDPIAIDVCAFGWIGVTDGRVEPLWIELEADVILVPAVGVNELLRYAVAFAVQGQTFEAGLIP